MHGILLIVSWPLFVCFHHCKIKEIFENLFSFLYLFHFFLATGKEKRKRANSVKDFFKNETVGRRCWTCRASLSRLQCLFKFQDAASAFSCFK